MKLCMKILMMAAVWAVAVPCGRAAMITLTDEASNTVTTGSTVSITGYNVTAGSDQFLVVGLFGESLNATSGPLAAGVTYDGDPLTLINVATQYVSQFDTNNQYVAFFAIEDPVSTGDIVATFTNGAAAAGDDISIGAFTLSNVGSLSAGSTTTGLVDGSTNTVSVTGSGSLDDAWVFGLLSANSTNFSGAGSPQVNLSLASAAGSASLGYVPVANAGDPGTVSWSQGGATTAFAAAGLVAVPVPEPGVVFLVAAGLLAVWALRHRSGRPVRV